LAGLLLDEIADALNLRVGRLVEPPVDAEGLSYARRAYKGVAGLVARNDRWCHGNARARCARRGGHLRRVLCASGRSSHEEQKEQNTSATPMAAWCPWTQTRNDHRM